MQHAPSPKRKLAWTLEQVQIDSVWIGVHPRLANDVVAEGLADGVVPQFVDAELVEREVVAGDSRVDFRVTIDTVPHWVEVKQVTLRAEDGMAAFPDAVTARGLKHVGELLRLVKDGGKASFLFAVAREDVNEVRPADEVDPAYCNALRAAAKQGVGVIAHRIVVQEEGLTLGAAIPVIL
ncbi:MAG: sugar fermentation stimulation protein A [Myxococcota bacterium]